VCQFDIARETTRRRGNEGRNRILGEEKEEEIGEIKKRRKCRREKGKRGIKGSVKRAEELVPVLAFLYLSHFRQFSSQLIHKLSTKRNYIMSNF